MSRRLLLLSILAMFALMLAACGGPAETPTEAPEEPPEEPVVEEEVIDCMGGEGSEVRQRRGDDSSGKRDQRG